MLGLFNFAPNNKEKCFSYLSRATLSKVLAQRFFSSQKPVYFKSLRWEIIYNYLQQFIRYDVKICRNNYYLRIIIIGG